MPAGVPVSRIRTRRRGGRLTSPRRRPACERRAADGLRAAEARHARGRRTAARRRRRCGGVPAVAADEHALFRPIAAGMVDPYSRRAVTALSVGVGLVFLVLCANAMNLMLTRLSARQREFGVCSALGASRARLLREAIAETALVGAGGGGRGTRAGRRPRPDRDRLSARRVPVADADAGRHQLARAGGDVDSRARRRRDRGDRAGLDVDARRRVRSRCAPSRGGTDVAVASAAGARTAGRRSGAGRGAPRRRRAARAHVRESHARRSRSQRRRA